MQPYVYLSQKFHYSVTRIVIAYDMHNAHEGST